MKREPFTITIPGMAEIRELEENQKACENQEPLTKEEEEKIQAVRDQLGTDFCRRCNYCAPCSVGIQIPSVFLFAFAAGIRRLPVKQPCRGADMAYWRDEADRRKQRKNGKQGAGRVDFPDRMLPVE